MKQTPGVTVRDADSYEGTQRYLLRNPNLSFIALVNEVLVGCAMCGHDGRRGYLQHLLVLPGHRRKGIANELVEHCLAALEKNGIVKAHIDVLTTNQLAQTYWGSQGWKRRTDIQRFSFVRKGGENV
ncbi:MAG: GNAT family N-acetyltransferase [Rhodoferax sp.]|uniref:GNAT family N-acetyltransferase n=1 Tax=Rhodoferax sp. TaxID=50421 RepID=UPI002614B927|nr:GNAT family N-acetyltransferase [Rhodoferax sp.]MDD2880805.1 GNAT family N-acetyltransferase [Rhodoferax sp.]